MSARRRVAGACWRQFSADAAAGRARPPHRTDEGIWIHEGSPYRDSRHLVWGSILWDAGKALAKFYSWNEDQLLRGAKAAAPSVRSRTVLELGAGTGVVGLTLGKLGASVKMTDFEPEVLDLLQQNVDLNGLAAAASVAELNWARPATYIRPAAGQFDMVVAADVLYSRKDRMFMRALEAHMRSGMVAHVACPPRADSPLAGFFDRMMHLGVQLERLENDQGDAVGSPLGSASDVYQGCRFVPLAGAGRCEAAVADAAGQAVQIFRLTWPTQSAA